MVLNMLFRLHQYDIYFFDLLIIHPRRIRSCSRLNRASHHDLNQPRFSSNLLVHIFYLYAKSNLLFLYDDNLIYNNKVFDSQACP